MSCVPAPRRRPLRERLSPQHPAYTAVIAAHDAAVAAGEERYTDPISGYGVFTAEALWRRGECCDTGCRHCPFTDGARG